MSLLLSLCFFRLFNDIYIIIYIYVRCLCNKRVIFVIQGAPILALNWRSRSGSAAQGPSLQDCSPAISIVNFLLVKHPDSINTYHLRASRLLLPWLPIKRLELALLRISQVSFPARYFHGCARLEPWHSPKPVLLASCCICLSFSHAKDTNGALGDRLCFTLRNFNLFFHFLLTKSFAIPWHVSPNAWNVRGIRQHALDLQANKNIHAGKREVKHTNHTMTLPIMKLSQKVKANQQHRLVVFALQILRNEIGNLTVHAKFKMSPLCSPLWFGLNLLLEILSLQVTQMISNGLQLLEECKWNQEATANLRCKTTNLWMGTGTTVAQSNPTKTRKQNLGVARTTIPSRRMFKGLATGSNLKKLYFRFLHCIGMGICFSLLWSWDHSKVAAPSKRCLDLLDMVSICFHVSFNFSMAFSLPPGFEAPSLCKETGQQATQNCEACMWKHLKFLHQLQLHVGWLLHDDMSVATFWLQNQSGERIREVSMLSLMQKTGNLPKAKIWTFAHRSPLMAWPNRENDYDVGTRPCAQGSGSRIIMISSSLIEKCVLEKDSKQPSPHSPSRC